MPLLTARGGCCVRARYVLSFPLALVVKGSAATTAVAVIGGSVGGVAAGFLWSAQGAYFAASARLYAQTSHGVTPEQATASFAARFAALFLGSELVLKVGARPCRTRLVPPRDPP